MISYFNILLLCIHSHAGHGETANCFSDTESPFSCSGAPGGQRSVGQQCCDDGFLAFTVFGSQDCTICSGKIWHL